MHVPRPYGFLQDPLFWECPDPCVLPFKKTCFLANYKQGHFLHYPLSKHKRVVVCKGLGFGGSMARKP